MYKKEILKLKDKVLNGYLLNKEEANYLIKIDNYYLEDILLASRAIKDKYIGKRISLCSIISGKVGRCSEDCKFCAQSAHYNTEIEETGLPTYEEFKNRAIESESFGIKRFSLVSSGRYVDKSDFEIIVKYYTELKKESNIELCASLGILDYEDLKKLKKSGVKRYHHNIETSKRKFKDICSTHKYIDRIETIKKAKRAGLKICSGGIIGMGESLEDRIEFIMELRELKVDSIPINILDPIKGTPLEKQDNLSEEEILKTLGVFRMVYPTVELRFAGGRRMIKKLQIRGIETSVNGMITGDFLTTIGNSIEEDLIMIRDYEIV
ncbi:MAG: biotin synthase BioB [Andreesenia angusta]|nr:biotin synthase BioB [Andreesenia angusta]